MNASTPAAPVSTCPACGAWSLPALAERSALLAVCDVLVTKALEVTGKRLVRVTRSRHAQLANRPWHVAHTVWHADTRLVDKALSGAWDVLPAMLGNHRAEALDLSPQQVTEALDGYVRALILYQTPHDLRSLRAWLVDRLSLTFPADER